MGKYKILIVDDEQVIRRLLVTFFTQKGYDAIAVESGLLGLSLLAKTQFDALLTDIRMPSMDGVEFSGKAKRANSDLVVILLTGYGSLETAQEAIKIGVHDYMTKPFDLVKLEESVNRGIMSAKNKKRDNEYYRQSAGKFNEDKERLDSMTAEMMALLSHELRTPATVISEGCSLLKDTICVPSDKNMIILSDEQKKLLFDNIEIGRRRLIRVIDDLSYYMSLHKEEIALLRRSMPLNNLLENDFAGLGHLISVTKSSLVKELTQQELIVNIDQEKFLDVLVRLINNAAYHNPKGCEIILKSSSVKRKQEGTHEQDFIKIEVCDNGQGIDKQALENIFHPFSVRNIMHHSEGLGLGLVICKKVIELHGGRITVESQQEKGTTVSIEIPAVSAPPLAHA